MLKEGICGFCMALADSVPGVSGGTVAFIMGFYDQFIGSIHNLVFGKRKAKKEAAGFLIKLGFGWIIGMILAVLLLSSLFESHIYLVSSLFIGFIAGSIPLIIKDEKNSFREINKGIWFCLMGILLVVGITWMNGKITGPSGDLSNFTILLGIKLFFVGMAAISAMFLPGISGSTLLLVFGVYMPVISAVRGLLGLDFSYIPALIFLGAGILAGIVSVVKGIQICLKKFRSQSVYMILGMMLGSFYAIMQGPTTLAVPQAAMSFGSIHIPALCIGIFLVAGMQILSVNMKNENAKK